MEKTSQQKETRKYFKKAASDWQHKMNKDKGGVFFAAPYRNEYVLKIAEQIKPVRALDVGCGSGDLVNKLAEKGCLSTGIDFADEMVDLAVKSAKKKGLNNATFICASVFEYEFVNKFDLISANGFIEYISHDQLKVFLKKIGGWLNPGGRLILGSRNRLFNIVSFNKFTSNEIKSPEFPS